MCSKPWLLFHKPRLLFPLESSDVLLILKQACSLFWQRRELSRSINTAHISTECAAVAALTSNPLQQHTSALMASQKWHVCCGNNYSFMLQLHRAAGPSIKPAVERMDLAACTVCVVSINHRTSGCRSSPPPLPPSVCLLCQILVCSQTGEWQPFTKPHFCGDNHLPSQTDDPPGPPTHSADSIIQRPPTLPPNYFLAGAMCVSDLCHVC